MKKTLFALVILFSLSSCVAGGFNRTQTGTVGGAGVGAGLGAIIGNQSGNPGAGVAIGAAAGALTGALLGNTLDKNDQASADARSRSEEQSRQIEENRRLLEELKRRGQDVYESDRGVVINLPDVLFQFNSHQLTYDSNQTVNEISSVLKSAKGRKIAIEGHTDSIGSVTYNKKLSLKRADSVARNLEQRGVSPFDMRVDGFGEGSPVATNNTVAGRARNRRVEIIIENR